LLNKADDKGIKDKILRGGTLESRQLKKVR